MKQTIYLPDDLSDELKIYLHKHTGETVSSLVQRALRKELGPEPKDLSPLMELKGIVKTIKEPVFDPERPEDSVVIGKSAGGI